MSKKHFYPSNPVQILQIGAAVMGCALLLGGLGVAFWKTPLPVLSFEYMGREKPEGLGRLDFSFPLKELSPVFLPPLIENELMFSFEPSRPDSSFSKNRVFVRLKSFAEALSVDLPCRIGLQCKGEMASFCHDSSFFWFEASNGSDGAVDVKVWVQTLAGEVVQTEGFKTALREKPFQKPEEFVEGAPFRFLAESRWLGNDLFHEKFTGEKIFRIGMAAPSSFQILDLKEEDWLVWREGFWTRAVPDQGAGSIARLVQADGKGLTLEGWDGDAYGRFLIPFSPPPPFKMKPEEMLHSIRIRSEKQVSCMMEKQCLILRSGDWVLRSAGRWKVLRKKEEREGYQTGKMRGELVVFEKIESRNGQKFVIGTVFDPDKTRSCPIDLPADKPLKKESGK